ncbi:MAG: transglutaminase domain-containing protein [Lachnospiraceae bacterium]|nr:transglutaminase domain-containing protein [Lachnospiraceae bacterium]
MKLSRRERGLVEFADIYSAKSGIAMDFGFSKLAPKERLIVCLLRGVLVFLCMFGTIGLFVSSFQLPCHMVLLALISFVFSVLLALLYYSYLSFNIGYIVFFVIFIGVTLLTARYSSSGMNAVINMVLKVVDEKLNLKGVRVYSEFYSNRTLTITCCLINVMALLLCLFNNVISGACSPFLTFLLIFPIAETSIYLNDSVNYFYVGMILFGFLGVVLLRYSHRYKMPMKGLAKNVSIKKNRVSRRAERFVFTMRHMIVAAAVSAVVLLALGGLVVSAAPKYMKNNYSTLKSDTDEIVKEIAVNGLSGLFNHYQSTGGLNEGKLGGIRSVSFDSETDLIVEHVPDNIYGMYLRGFVGDRYQDNSWSPARDTYFLSRSPYNMSASDISDALNAEMTVMKERMLAGEEQTATAQIRITNVDATMFYHYAPYYSELPVSGTDTRGDYRDVSLRNKPGIYTYYPISQIDDLMEQYQGFPELLLPYRTNSKVLKLYQRYVHNHYVNLPDNVREVALQIAEEKLTGTDPLTVVHQLIEYFETEFTYTLQPGITPRNKDFVTYFLTEQKKGLCAHFATAATVLLRAKGIPARYVEGYHLQYDDALEMSEIEGENPDDWYQGYNGTLQEGDSLAVMKANITDASAHAWTEIYVDGFGWYPLDFTVADYDFSESESFWSRFGGLLRLGDDITDSPVAAVAGGIRSAAPFVLIVILAALGAGLLLYIMLRIRRMYRLYHLANNKRLVYQYTALTKLLKKFDKVEEKNIYHRNMVAYLKDKVDADSTETARYIALVEEASFSNRALSKEELEEATLLFKKLFKGVRAKFNGRERLNTLLTY